MVVWTEVSFARVVSKSKSIEPSALGLKRVRLLEGVAASALESGSLRNAAGAPSRPGNASLRAMLPTRTSI